MGKNRSGKRKRPNRNYIKPGSYDFTVLFIVLTLVLFGVVMIFSSSYYDTMTQSKFDNDMYYFLKKQAVWAVIGIIGMVIAMHIPYSFWKRFALAMYWLSNVFLALLPFVGVEAGGQKRWLPLGPIQFQPSEFTKVAVILYFSLYVCQHRKSLWNRIGFTRAVMVLGIPVGLIALSNFSSALLLFLTGAAILFLASPKVQYFIGLAAAGLAAAAVFILPPQYHYRLGRLLIWLDPWTDPKNDGFQSIQSLYAVGSGGLFGLGLGQSRQKTFMPEAYNDFIFAIICEELGLIGAALVILLFAVLIWRGIRIAIHAKDYYGMYVAAGITALFAFQSIINMAVVTNTIPNTGQPLPFISYGGSSLLFLMGLAGILLNISKYPKTKESE